MLICRLAVLFLLVAACQPALAQRRAAGIPQCDIVAMPKAVADLPEGSGLALSRRFPRRLFSLNDSPTSPELMVLGLDGANLGRVTVRGAQVRDWEDLTAGPCPGGTCLYVGDIGDNDAVRPTITVYRVLEPKEGDRTATPERFDGAYPDGPHDAEAMFMGTDGRLFLLTKEPRGATLYAWPRTLTAGRVHTLERIGRLAMAESRRRFARITDAEASLDGRLVTIRTNDTLYVVPTADIQAGRLTNVREIDLRPLREPQGEGVALGQDGDVFLFTEGGARGRPGGLSRLRCQQAR